MVSYWSLSDSKSPLVTRTLFSVLDGLNNVVVRIVSTHPLISKFSSPFINPLVTIPRAPIIISITVTFIFHIFFPVLWQGLSSYLSFSLSFSFTLWSARTAKSNIQQVLNFFFFLLTITWFCHMAKIRRSVCISKYYYY